MVMPSRGTYCRSSSLVGELPPWPSIRSLAMDALSCSLSLLFMSHFLFQFVKQFHEVERGCARRRAFHDAFPHGLGFCDTDIAVNDSLEHETRSEEFFDLPADLAVKDLPAVK